jgi:filamin
VSAYVTRPSGVVEDCDVFDLEDCHYCVRFVAREMGIHSVSVKHRDIHIEGSPFEYTVGSIDDGGSHKVISGGLGVVKGEVNLKSR